MRPTPKSKFGMTILSLGMAEEFRAAGVAVNCLWPRTLVATSAIEFAVPGGAALFARSRKPEIMADAAAAVLANAAGGVERGVPAGRGFPANARGDVFRELRVRAGERRRGCYRIYSCEGNWYN